MYRDVYSLSLKWISLEDHQNWRSAIANTSNESAIRLRNVDLNLLKIFQAVVSQKSVSQAASLLCVSQPAVSNALRRLREIYNDPLFVRTASGMVLTPKAQELAGPIDEALDNIQRTMLIGEQFQPRSSQRIFNVALTDYGEFTFLPQIVSHLHQKSPGIEIVCLPNPGAALCLEMKSGAVDLVWDWVKVEDPDYFAEPIFSDEGYCLVRKGHPLINGELTLESFLEVEHVALLPTRQHQPRIERALEAKGLERKVVVEVSHLVVIPQIVATTDLVATLPKRLATYFAKQMDLQLLPNPAYTDAVVVYQMWHKHFAEDEGHIWFRNLTKKIVSEF